MKITLILLLSSCLAASAQLFIHGQTHLHGMNQRYGVTTGSVLDVTPATNSPVPSIIDPTRLVNGTPVSTLGDGWMLFYGKVLDETNKTIIIQGSFSHDPVLLDEYRQPHIFAVIGFPYRINVSDSIPLGNQEDGFYSAMIQPRSWLNLNGTNYAAILNYHTVPNYTVHKPTPAQQAEINKRLMASLLNQATNGDAGAQCIMAMHYLKGDCCETNKALAVEWLKISADNGNVDASNELSINRQNL